MFELIAMTFKPIAMLLFLGLVGILVISKRIMPEQALGALSPLALEIALPAMIFVNILSGFHPVGMDFSWLQMPGWWLAFTVASFGLAWLLTKIFRARYTDEFRASLFFQNGIFLPLIYVTEVYGNNSSELLSLFFFSMLYPAFTFNVYGYFFKGASRDLDLKKVFHPVFIATIIAISGAYFGLEKVVPSFLTSGLKSVGNISVPLVMIIVGGSVYLDLKQRGQIDWVEVSKFVIAKNIIYPLITLVILYYLHPPKVASLLIMLQAAAPPLTALPIFVERAKGNRTIAAQHLLFSFLATIVTLPIVMMIWELLYR